MLDDLPTVYANESHNSGENLLDPKQPVFAVAAVIADRFGVDYTLGGLDLLLHRIGWNVQIPARRAAERDEGAVVAWKDQQWPVVKGWRRTWGRGCASKTRPARV